MIYVLDQMNIVGIVDDYQSVIWNVQYYGLNDFQIILSGSSENIDLLKIGRYLCRDRGEGIFENAMLIEKTELSYDAETGWILTVRGGGLKALLKRRIIWSQINASGTVENTIRQVLTENVINPSDSSRAIPDFILGDSQGFTEEAEIQLLGENVAEWISTACETYGYGWDVSIKNGKYVFDLYKGTDHTYMSASPVIFSPEYDNLLSFDYSYDMAGYSNAALIGGEGEGINKRTATVGDAVGLDRIESFIDGSSVSSNGEIITLNQYLEMLKSFGKEELAKVSKTSNFAGEIEPNSTFKLNEDYYLGDLVQVDNNNGETAVTRIIEIIYAEDENGSTVTPTFTEWEV